MRIVLIIIVLSSLCRPAYGQETLALFDSPRLRVVNSIDFSASGHQMFLALLYHDFLGDSAEAVGAPVTALFSSERSGSGWGTPELLWFSGVYQDYEPTLSADGRLMVFNSRRPYDDGRVPTVNDLWFTELGADSAWSAPRRIESITSFDYEESYGTLTADRSLVFMAGRPGADGSVQYDLMVSRYEDGSFGEPGLHPVSTDEWGEGDPWIAPDGSYLIFTRWDPAAEWHETVDLYISLDRGQGWTEPRALERLNTPGPDYGAAISPDGTWLYYRTGSDFLRIRLDDVLRELDNAPPSS